MRTVTLLLWLLVFVYAGPVQAACEDSTVIPLSPAGPLEDLKALGNPQEFAPELLAPDCKTTLLELNARKLSFKEMYLPNDVHTLSQRILKRNFARYMAQVQLQEQKEQALAPQLAAAQNMVLPPMATPVTVLVAQGQDGGFSWHGLMILLVTNIAVGFLCTAWAAKKPANNPEACVPLPEHGLPSFIPEPAKKHGAFITNDKAVKIAEEPVAPNSISLALASLSGLSHVSGVEAEYIEGTPRQENIETKMVQRRCDVTMGKGAVKVMSGTQAAGYWQLPEVIGMSGCPFVACLSSETEGVLEVLRFLVSQSGYAYCLITFRCPQVSCIAMCLPSVAKDLYPPKGEAQTAP